MQIFRRFGFVAAVLMLATCLSGQTLRHHLSGAVNTSFALGLRQVEVRITRPYTTVGITPDDYVDNVLGIRKLTKA